MDRPKITPHQFNLYTSQVSDIYVALEDDLFQMIAKRLKTNPALGKDYVLQWQIDKMQQLRMFNLETINALSEATGLSADAIRSAISDVGYDTIRSIDEEVKRLYKKLPPPTQIDLVLESFVRQTFLQIDNFVNQTLISTTYGVGTIMQMYRKIIEESTAKVLAGNKTINQAVAETIIKWGNKGIETSFIDKGGNVWHLERYVDTVIRSTVNNTYNEMTLSRMDDYDIDLVLVSSLPDAREACSMIQGKVASKSNPSAHPDYPSIYEFGYGTPSGLRGISCRHRFYAFVEGLNTNNQIQYDPEEAYERGKVVQQQRAYERQIKKAKRSLNLAEEVGDADSIQKYKNLVRSRQADIREFVAENKLPRRYDKEKIY